MPKKNIPNRAKRKTDFIDYDADIDENPTEERSREMAEREKLLEKMRLKAEKNRTAQPIMAAAAAAEEFTPHIPPQNAAAAEPTTNIPPQSRKKNAAEKRPAATQPEEGRKKPDEERTVNPNLYEYHASSELFDSMLPSVYKKRSEVFDDLSAMPFCSKEEISKVLLSDTSSLNKYGERILDLLTVGLFTTTDVHKNIHIEKNLIKEIKRIAQERREMGEVFADLMNKIKKEAELNPKFALLISQFAIIDNLEKLTKSFGDIDDFILKISRKVGNALPKMIGEGTTSNKALSHKYGVRLFPEDLRDIFIDLRKEKSVAAKWAVIFTAIFLRNKSHDSLDREFTGRYLHEQVLGLAKNILAMDVFYDDEKLIENLKVAIPQTTIFDHLDQDADAFTTQDDAGDALRQKRVQKILEKLSQPAQQQDLEEIQLPSWGSEVNSTLLWWSIVNFYDYFCRTSQDSAKVTEQLMRGINKFTHKPEARIYPTKNPSIDDPLIKKYIWLLVHNAKRMRSYSKPALLDSLFGDLCEAGSVQEPKESHIIRGYLQQSPYEDFFDKNREEEQFQQREEDPFQKLEKKISNFSKQKKQIHDVLLFYVHKLLLSGGLGHATHQQKIEQLGELNKKLDDNPSEIIKKIRMINEANFDYAAQFFAALITKEGFFETLPFFSKRVFFGINPQSSVDEIEGIARQKFEILKDIENHAKLLASANNEEFDAEKIDQEKLWWKICGIKTMKERVFSAFFKEFAEAEFELCVNINQEISNDLEFYRLNSSDFLPPLEDLQNGFHSIKDRLLASNDKNDELEKIKNENRGSLLAAVINNRRVVEVDVQEGAQPTAQPAASGAAVLEEEGVDQGRF